MRNRLLLLMIPILLFACTQKPKPVAQVAADSRAPVAIMYVGVPTMSIHMFPGADTAVISKYGFGETVSVLAHKGEWAELRMFDNRSGWVLASELMTAEQAKEQVSEVPHFYREPAKVEGGRSHGQIEMQAKVGADGVVTTVQVTKNTTGNNALAEQNATALQQAQFYPVSQKGQRMTFTYTHSVWY